MLGYLSADIICFEKQTVFRERSSRKTVNFEEQIMSKDKYQSTVLRQMEAIVFIYLFICLFIFYSCNSYNSFTSTTTYSSIITYTITPLQHCTYLQYLQYLNI